VINDNSIPSLQNDNFILRVQTDLEELHVLRCEVETIQLGAFNGLIKLTHPSLSRIEIREIIPRTSEKMSSLVYLVLGDNIIEHLEVDVVYGLVNLKQIYLEENILLGLHPDMFVGLPKLWSTSSLN